MTFSRLASLACAAALISACSGGGGGTGRLTVRIVDGPADVKELWLDVQKVEIQGPQGWQTLSKPSDGPFDVMQLTGGVSKTLADRTLTAGTYSQLRLVLGSSSWVILGDGTRHDLTVPSGQQSGVKLVGSFTVVPNTTRDVYIDFLAFRSIFVHETGASAKYVLRPTVRSYDKLETGAISGRLVDAATQAPLAGAEVFAEELDSTGAPAVVSRAVTDANGAYLLDGLPALHTYHVVSQPRAAGKVYLARASGPFPIDDAAPTPTWDAAFDAATQVGAIAGTIRDAATDAQDDTVFARQTLDAGGTPRLLVVRMATGAVVDGAESYVIPEAPAGPYSVVAVRRADGAPDVTKGPVDVTVEDGATAPASFQF
jgi:hypothetical protein